MTTLFDESTSREKPVVPDLQDLSHARFSPSMSAFLRQYEANFAKMSPVSASTIRVSDVLGSIAHLYERIRNTIEYKGAHVLRRNAIERILKRLLWERPSQPTERLASILIRELIWARYLANDMVPKSKATEIARIITKYVHFLGYMREHGFSVPESKLKQWIWGVASCEIEETLDPSNREPYVELMQQWFKNHFVWLDEEVAEQEKEIQIFLGIHRAFTKSDDEIMRYHLLIKAYPQWVHADAEEIKALANNFFGIYAAIEKHLEYPERFILYRLIQKHTAPFDVLRTLVRQEKLGIKDVLQDEKKLEEKIREICQVKYNEIRKRVNRGIVRSIIYIFLTKVFLALLIEVPYELYRFGTLAFIPLGINVVVPPTMMALIGSTIRTPGENNTVRLISRIKSIVYKNEEIAKTSFNLTRVQRSSFAVTFFSIIYLILFILVFGSISYVLYLLHFTIVGVGIFFVFLSLVLLFGFRVRYTASELKVTGEREGIFSHLFNNVTLPFLRAGVFLSKGLAQLNFLTILLDFLIEAPLKTIIEVVEEWTSFVREKRDEVVEVPEQ